MPAEGDWNRPDGAANQVLDPTQPARTGAAPAAAQVLAIAAPAVAAPAAAFLAAGVAAPGPGPLAPINAGAGDAEARGAVVGTGAEAEGYASDKIVLVDQAAVAGRAGGALDSAAHSTAIWSTARVQQLAPSGDVAAHIRQSRPPSAAAVPSQEDALRVSDQAVHALFGRSRAIILRISNLPMQIERQKEWKVRNAQRAQMTARGARVPEDFCPSHFFWTWQFARTSLLDHSPLLVFELEQWA